MARQYQLVTVPERWQPLPASLFNIGLFLWVLPAINRRPLEPIDTEEGDRHP